MGGGRSRGGARISYAYVNSSAKMEWKGARGHRRLAMPNTNWCGRLVRALLFHRHYDNREDALKAMA